MDPAGSEIITLSIPSRLELLPVLDRLVQGITEQMEFDEDQAGDVAMSVIEAGTNAIQHGHRQDPSKMVEFRFDMFPDHLLVTVRDSGPGFDVSAVLSKDPTRPEDLLKSCGRGIFIMRALMDSVEFEIRPQQGTKVQLVKLKRSNGSSPR
ncbi:MAG: ATP-binding protein [Candidatus Eisenbacteria bacterium]|nr:ATP-binding protein [Candidatus Eisenbacteria bacterium]